MHDESCPTYQDMLLNLHRGHMFLHQNFGYTPRVAWSLENSGQSAANPRLLSESGIEAMFILHIDPEERQRRLEYSEMEFVWRPMYSHLGRKSEMLGHIFYDFNTSPLDLLVMDQRISDPTNGHVVPNKTEPVGPPPEPH